ncbi:MAG TPA: AMMECR1 domain-containing protein [Candidatus Marinimicrobia bacterium]|nr:AMMECR1 domain-containing protein [Candidatus Neomarinimicrobiota bacterium]
MNLSDIQKRALLKLARETIHAHLSHQNLPSWILVKELKTLGEIQSGAFVTLTIQDDLRGCIGLTESRKPLPDVIQEMAIAAATQDPRFPRVGLSELPLIKIEISVLTPPEIVPDLELIEIGRHGLVVEQGWNRGLLLPQVATEWDWDREEFLAHTCEKAGLRHSAARDSRTTVYWFEAIIFSEAESVASPD